MACITLGWFVLGLAVGSILSAEERFVRVVPAGAQEVDLSGPWRMEGSTAEACLGPGCRQPLPAGTHRLRMDLQLSLADAGESWALEVVPPECGILTIHAGSRRLAQLADTAFVRSRARQPSFVAVPAWALTDGRLSIELELTGLQREVRVRRSPVLGRSGPMGDRLQAGHRNAMLADVPRLALAAIFCFCGLQYLLLARRARPDYRRFGLLAIALAGVTAAETAWTEVAMPDSIAGRLTPALMHVAIVAGIRFLWPFLDAPAPRWLRWYSQSNLVLAALLIFEPSGRLGVLTNDWRSAYLLPLVFGVIASVAGALQRRRPGARLLGAAAVLAAVATAVEVIAAWRGSEAPDLLPWSIAAIVLLMAWSLSDRFHRAMDELDRINSKLEDEVARQTAEIREANSRLAAFSRTMRAVNTEMARSVSHARLAEQQARDARHEAVAANRAKSDFLATMSHEIRTPLNGIIGMSGLLVGATLNAEQRDFAETINRAGQSLLALITDILDFSKIEAGKSELEVAPFDPRTLADTALEIVGEQAGRKGLDLAALVDPEVPQLLAGDAGRIRQILVNLLGNAVKFTAAGEVVARVEALAPAGAAEPAVELRFSVEDTGIGIDPAAAKLLFEPFTQGDASTARRYGGTGLGLAISRRLVEQMEGCIGVEGAEGAGARFWFTLCLPVVEAPPMETPFAGRRALLAEHHPPSRLMTARMLERLGFEVETPASGNTPPAAAFDVVVADLEARDVVLPQWPPAIRLIRAGQRHTGPAITKPVTLSRLRRALDSALGHPVASPAALAAAVSAGGRVLVVEDNAINQKVMLAALRKLGYSAELASGGEEAIKMATSGGYDAILMDCVMPGMDGFEATRRIRAIHPHAPPAIVAVTANVFREDEIRCREAGMDDYLSKPVQMEALAEMLVKWLPHQPTGAPEFCASSHSLSGAK